MNFPAEEGKPRTSEPILMVGWTTTGTREEAEKLGRGLVEAGLAACAQIDGPLTSIYRWEGRLETATEFRLTLKFAGPRAAEIEGWLQTHHSYDTPQWTCVVADRVAKNYLNWVLQTST